MSEQVKNRKWVTKAIIGFVAVLALLTFFSNTIMNAMIPKVIAKRATRGNLSYTNNASAVVEPVTSCRVKGIEGRVIDQVLVSDYDYVEEGDVLMTLTPVEDQSALDDLRTQLTELQREANYAARTPDDTDLASMRASISSAQVSLDEARQQLSAARNKDDAIAAANRIIDQNRPLSVSLEAEVESASSTLESLNAQIATLESEIQTREDQITTLINLGVPTPTPTPLPVITETPDEGEGEGEGGDTPTPPGPVSPSTVRIGELRAEIEERQIQISQLRSQVSSAESRLSDASSRLADCNAAIEEAQAAITTAEGLPSVSSARSSVESAEAGLSSAQRAYANAQTNDGIARDRARDEANDRAAKIAKLETQIAELEANLNALEIKAPASGQVFALAVGDGDTMEKDAVILIIVPDDSDYTISFKFPAASITGLQPGMQLTSDEYWLDSCEILSIKPDPESPRESRIVKCSLEADYILPGESVSVVANRSNQDYDHIIASSAVNEDNSGTFVYQLREERSPFGNRYTVHRVDVTVDATDGALSAVSGNGLDDGMIVIRSEEALEDGQRVRLEDFTGN
ncbi:MAG: HlyD family efflux transporter periplasmic adaptor subunit [Clostridiales bacterium]|nr:HlyD family efflux transporter periplasmic adaptor subunit [Clostridiales bacterium]